MSFDFPTTGMMPPPAPPMPTSATPELIVLFDKITDLKKRLQGVCEKSGRIENELLGSQPCPTATPAIPHDGAIPAHIKHLEDCYEIALELERFLTRLGGAG